MGDFPGGGGKAGAAEWSRSRPGLLALIVAMSMAGPIALNIFMPSMPGLVSYFATDYGTVQLALTLYLLAMAGSQLFLGPLSDRLGRRPVLLYGIALYVLASLAAAAAFSVGWLIAARMAQASGGAAGLVIARTVIRDLYDRDRAASMIGYAVMAATIAPMLAPGIGGRLDIAFGWQASFLFCAGFGLLVLAVCLRYLPETRPVHLKNRGFLTIFRDARSLLSTPAFLGYAGCSASGAAMFFSFLGGAPYVVINLMGHSEIDYGDWFVVGAIGYMAGNFASGALSARLGTARMVLAGTTLGMIGSALILAFTLTGSLDIQTLFGALIITAFSNGLILPNALAAAVSVNPDIAGSASGLAGFIQMLAGALAAQIVGSLMADSALPMAVAMFAAACLSAASLALVTFRSAR